MYIVEHTPEFSFSRKRRTLSASPIELKEKDKKILRAVHKLRAVEVLHIEKLFGISQTYAKERLTLLYDNAYLELVPRPYAPKQLVYRLGSEGARVLAAEMEVSLASFRYWGKGDDKDRRKTEVSPYFIEHTLELTSIRIAFQQSAEVNGFTVEEWRDESEMRRPENRIRVSIEPAPGKPPELVTLYPDGYFRLRTPHESVCTRWKRKILAYKEYVRSRAFHEAYGLSGGATPLRILTTTPSKARAENLKEAVEAFGLPKLSTMFLFARLAMVLERDALTSPIWMRAGNPLTETLTS
jgi:hypothetical protein